MRCWATWLGVALAWVGAPARAQDAPVLLDRVVAVVGDRLVLASDLAVEQALCGRDLRAERALRCEGRDPLDLAIDAAIVRGLAGNVAIYDPAPSEVRARLDALRAAWVDPKEDEAFLTACGLDEGSLQGLLYSRIVVERYVHRTVTLASEAAGESESEAAARYQAWITTQRGMVTLRLVAPREAPW